MEALGDRSPLRIPTRPTESLLRLTNEIWNRFTAGLREHPGASDNLYSLSSRSKIWPSGRQEGSPILRLSPDQLSAICFSTPSHNLSRAPSACSAASEASSQSAR